MTKRKIILYIATSLDGFIADTKGQIDWLGENSIAKEADTSYEDFYQSVDTVIMGRTTYDQVTQILSPDDYPYKDSQSYVITSREGDNKKDVTFTDESVVTLVKKLKETDGGDVFIIGGASIINPLIQENLIDEYQLAIIPTILGEGIPLFSSSNNQVKLTAINANVVNNIVYHTYIPQR